jgi:WD40 repeat protein
MFSTKSVRPLALIAVIGIVAIAASANGAEKKRRRLMQNINDPYLAFVPGQPLLLAAERGRSMLFLSCPELGVARTLDVPQDRKLESIKTSPDGTWIATFFEQSSFRTGGTLRVSKITGETQLLLDDASRAFDFLDDKRLIAWQPKSGITQWELGGPEARRIGAPITSVTDVFRDYLYFSPDGRYLLIKGTCHGDDPKADLGQYCVFDLSDSATLAWTDDPETHAGGKFTRQFTELLVATNIDSTGGTAKEACRKAGENRELCSDAAAVTLVDTTSGRTALWTIRAGDEIGRFINSAALSSDGRWVAVASMGVTVSLFDTGHLEPKKNFLNGAWQEPVMIKQIEMP